jgi:hypothetical protein
LDIHGGGEGGGDCWGINAQISQGQAGLRPWGEWQGAGQGHNMLKMAAILLLVKSLFLVSVAGKTDGTLPAQILS